MENFSVQTANPKVSGSALKGARSPELESIKAVMNYYIEGIRNGDAATLQKCFHPQSSLFGYKGDDLIMAPIQMLYDYVTGMPVPVQTGELPNFIFTSIQVNGKMATVELAMDSYHGHNFLDHFQLLKVEDRGWIVSKIFYAEPQNQ